LSYNKCQILVNASPYYRSEKERQNLTIEIDVVTSELENVRQNALADHSRAEGLEAQLARLRAQVQEVVFYAGRHHLLSNLVL